MALKEAEENDILEDKENTPPIEQSERTWRSRHRNIRAKKISVSDRLYTTTV